MPQCGPLAYLQVFTVHQEPSMLPSAKQEMSLLVWTPLAVDMHCVKQHDGTVHVGTGT